MPTSVDINDSDFMEQFATMCKEIGGEIGHPENKNGTEIPNETICILDGGYIKVEQWPPKKGEGETKVERIGFYSGNPEGSLFPSKESDHYAYVDDPDTMRKIKYHHRWREPHIMIGVESDESEADLKAGANVRDGRILVIFSGGHEEVAGRKPELVSQSTLVT